MPTPRRIRAYSFKQGEPPSEIQLWNVGENSTDYGIHIWNERSVKEVLDEYEKRGNPLQIDIEHNNAQPADPSHPGPTGGYARLEIRDGAPWLVFDWSQYAIEQIATRQRLFLSPEYEVDTETGEIIKLIRVSLVGDPGTHNARMLASSLRSKRVRAGGKRMDLAVILSALKVVLTTEDAEEARKQIEALVAEIESLAMKEDEPASEELVEAENKDEEVQAQADEEEEEEEEKPVVAAKASKKGLSNEAIKLAQRVATLEAEVLKAQRRERIAAYRDRIPDNLLDFAHKLNLDQLDEFIKGLPEPKTMGIRASSRVTQGDKQPVAEGHLDEEDRKALDRAFGRTAVRTKSLSRDGHRVIASHVYKRGQ